MRPWVCIEPIRGASIRLHVCLTATPSRKNLSYFFLDLATGDCKSLSLWVNKLIASCCLVDRLSETVVSQLFWDEIIGISE